MDYLTFISIITLLAILTIRFELFIKKQKEMEAPLFKFMEQTMEVVIEHNNRISDLEDKLGEK